MCGRCTVPCSRSGAITLMCLQGCVRSYGLCISVRHHMPNQSSLHTVWPLPLMTSFRTNAALGTEMPVAQNPHPETGKAQAHAVSLALDTLHLTATSSIRSQFIYHLRKKDSLITMFLQFCTFVVIYSILVITIVFIYYHCPSHQII